MLGNPEVARFTERYGIIVVVAVMMLALTILKPDVFFTVTNLTNIVKQNASAALLALGMFVVILTAGIDLSVGSVMALAMVSLAVANRAGHPWEVIILIGPLVGIAAGWVNGVGLTWLRLPHPFIMTLGTLNIARGLTNLVSGGAPVSGLKPEVRYMGQKTYDFGIFQPPAGIPASFFLVTLCAVGLWFFLNRTSIGRHIYAIGGN
ncbi:MAG: ABC transporter permease, partial [Aestuariivirgaceae bacterium]